MRGGDSGLEGYQEEQERRYTEQERCCQKGGNEGCRKGEIQEMRDANLVMKWR